MITEGKTKRLELLENFEARVHSKDDLTARDGAKRHVLPGKGKLANATTCNVFDLLKLMEVPLAYLKRDGDTFITEVVEMIPVEVVVRNEAAGSFCKRHPEVPAGTLFAEPVVEFYYKTKDKQFFSEILEENDPLMVFADEGRTLSLHHPGRPVDEEHPMLWVGDRHIRAGELIKLHGWLQHCANLSLEVNRHLKRAWERVGGRLIDFKCECGINRHGKIVVADVIDCDSWRVLWKGQQLSKQKYRDDEPLDEVLRVYQIAEERSRQFVDLAVGW